MDSWTSGVASPEDVWMERVGRVCDAVIWQEAGFHEDPIVITLARGKTVLRELLRAL